MRDIKGLVRGSKCPSSLPRQRRYLLQLVCKISHIWLPPPPSPRPAIISLNYCATPFQLLSTFLACYLHKTLRSKFQSLQNLSGNYFAVVEINFLYWNPLALSLPLSMTGRWKIDFEKNEAGHFCALLFFNIL